MKLTSAGVRRNAENKYWRTARAKRMEPMGM
jgi:hypothetical protein